MVISRRSSLFHKKLGPYFKAWGSLLVLVAVGMWHASHTYPICAGLLKSRLLKLFRDLHVIQGSHREKWARYDDRRAPMVSRAESVWSYVALHCQFHNFLFILLISDSDCNVASTIIGCGPRLAMDRRLWIGGRNTL